MPQNLNFEARTFSWWDQPRIHSRRIKSTRNAILRREPMAVLASETASATAGREGKASSPDGKINLNLSPARIKRPRHQPRAIIRGRLFGLLRRRD
jgi:hypothetical protein